jgi:hypothetical protein
MKVTALFPSLLPCTSLPRVHDDGDSITAHISSRGRHVLQKLSHVFVGDTLGYSKALPKLCRAIYAYLATVLTASQSSDFELKEEMRRLTIP